MRGRADFVHLENSRFIVITLRCLPGKSAKIIGVVESGIVIAPVGDMLDRACAGDGYLPLSGLSDEPVGHVAAIAVSADSEMVAIGDAIFHKRIDTFENVFAGTRNQLRNDSLNEVVAIAAGAAIVRLEDQPSLIGREPVPLIPVGLEVVAIGI